MIMKTARRVLAVLLTILLVASCTAELSAIRQRIEKVVSAPGEPTKVEPVDIL